MIGRLRKAWCELTGGHHNRILGGGMGRGRFRASHVQLYCERCGRKTAWFVVPSLGKEEPRQNDTAGYCHAPGQEATTP